MATHIAKIPASNAPFVLVTCDAADFFVGDGVGVTVEACPGFVGTVKVALELNSAGTILRLYGFAAVRKI